VGVLEAADIPYMVAGSFASTFHGMVRATQDVDVVVVLDRSGIQRLLAELPDDQWYASEEAALDAVRRCSEFNVLDMETGWKADLIVRKARPFSRAEFERRVRTPLLGVTTWVATAEDTIVAKLEWRAKGGGSERQMADVVGILRSVGDRLDRAYLERWAAELGLTEDWNEAQRVAETEHT
jgi:hypothetical protein